MVVIVTGELDRSDCLLLWEIPGLAGGGGGGSYLSEIGTSRSCNDNHTTASFIHSSPILSVRAKCAVLLTTLLGLVFLFGFPP